MSRWQSIGAGCSAERRPGVYALIRDGKVMYVGSSVNLYHRLWDGYRLKLTLFGALVTPWGTWERGDVKVKYSRCAGDWLMDEYRLIIRLRPSLNYMHNRRRTA